ncbi:MAG: 30S ribosomal protein S17e [Nanoarchaeota archaeon]|nr:30S ribosomal protein S17e [Nanoarchaeota archaeon]
MGKIKSRMVRRAAKEMKDKGVEFSTDFEKNKKMLGNNTMPSKKIRNRMAGFLTREARKNK